jgi:hypothetical protein
MDQDQHGAALRLSFNLGHPAAHRSGPHLELESCRIDSLKRF